ncbi:MAG: BamA/TamA family outer membrane protein [Bacteroidales bacterium]|nr:BamA/TamA family outer membrane protein [Bacteroidales bacterium]
MTFLFFLALCLPLAGQEKTDQEIRKEGVSFGAFPILGYERDQGIQLGVMGNLYDFGKKNEYPNPRQQLYVEASWFMKGSQRYALSYDNRFLIPGIRFTFAAQFTNDKALPFYGFGGYASYYDATLPTPYYRMSRMMPAGKLDFTGRIGGNFYWKFGYHFKYFILDEFDSSQLHDLPFGKSLFAWYKDMGFIEPDEFKGGMTSAWRLGLSYDSRDAESMPSRGLWADVFAEWAPKWMGTNKPYGRYYAVLRQYFPLSGDKLVFAYRAVGQGFIGKPGFYMLPIDAYLGGPGYDREGFGGYRTIRGVLQNRIQGKSVCYFNTELRWRFLDTQLWNQNLSLGANAFFDGGRVLQNYTDVSVDAATWQLPVATGKFPEQLTKGGREAFHISAGAGLRLILNRNFIISLDYGHAFSRQDGGMAGSLYFNTGYLF